MLKILKGKLSGYARICDKIYDFVNDGSLYNLMIYKMNISERFSVDNFSNILFI